MKPRKIVRLSKEFYNRNPAAVAKDLLGNILLRKLNSAVLSGKIVETEAYCGRNDPASRAHKGKKKYNELMFSSVGRAFIFMVHGHWLLNVVAHPKDHVGAVLIRGIEPIGSIHYDPEISNSILEGIPLEEGKAKEDMEEIMNLLEDLVT